MIYLTLGEISTYTSVAGITQQIINQASTIIDTFIGNIDKQQTNQVVNLSKKFKGKLNKIRTNVPLISVDQVQAISKSMFGISYEDYDASQLIVDEQGYFDFYPNDSIYLRVYGNRVSQLSVTYTYGYETAPEDLKLACGLLCQNLAKRGSFGAKSITDYDVQLTFLDDSIMTSDIRNILLKYRGV